MSKRSLGPRPPGAYLPPDVRFSLSGNQPKFSMRRLPDGSFTIREPLDDPQYRTRRKQEFVAALVAKAREQYANQLPGFLDALPLLLHKHLEFSDVENEEIYQAVRAALEECGRQQ